MKKSLTGIWKFKSTTEDEWLKATVPGCNYTDLLNLGKIPDPFDGINEKEVFWVALMDWEYTREFTIEKSELDYEKITLICDMLDTVCDILINNVLVGKGKNAHVQYIFDIKKYLVEGENTICIVFYSPVKYINEKQAKEKCPKNWNGMDGIQHIRKPQCHFGWDWGPVLPPSGITKNIEIELTKIAKIKELTINQTHEDKKVTLLISARIDNFANGILGYELEIIQPSKPPIIFSGECGSTMVTTVNIENPELWWTNDLSGKAEQPLYIVRLTIAKEGITADKSEKTIGLRTLILNRERDRYGSNFQFVLNGVPLFVKGANWIPPDSFINRFSSEKLNYYINAALFSNMNMLRVWGGGYYESDEMYALCDKVGILLWQDFAFACQPYPFFDADFLSNVKQEVKNIVSRLGHHACLAVWCGNNEIEALSAAWPLSRKFIIWTERFFYHILEPEIRKYDISTCYIPGSPCGVSHKKGYNKDNVGDTHLWAVWHGLQPMDYYRSRMTRFCSEFGFESLPDIKTIQRFAKPADYSLTSAVFKAHQKCMSGNMKMVYYIAARFRLPKKFVDFIYLSQVAQQECVADAIEHWRRNKGRCNGSMFWQLNDCWPVCSWSSIDYFGNYKALQYTARHCNAPVSVSIENNKENIRIFALNDYKEDITVIVQYSIFDFEKGILKRRKKEITVESLSNIIVYYLSVDELGEKYALRRTGLLAEMFVGDKLISRKTVLFNKEKNLELPKAKLKKTVEISDKHSIITVESDCYARLIRLESLCSALPFSDNYFDLLPGESKTIIQELDPTCSPEEQAEKIALFCCSDVESNASRVSDFITRMQIFFKPVNFIGWLYYKMISKDYKYKE